MEITNRIQDHLIRLFIIFLGITIAGSDLAAGQNLLHTLLVDKLYGQTGNKLVWFLPGEQSNLLRQTLKNKIDSSINIGLKKNKYHSNEISQYTDKSFSEEDSLAAMQQDRLFTDAAIAYCKDVYQGVDIDHWMSYDEISKKYEEADNTYLVNNLITAISENYLLHFLNSLEPNGIEYLLLKNKLQSKPDSLTSLQKMQLTSSINFYRWVHHFHFEKYIVVNIPSATLRYYEYDSAKLIMKVVVGKPSPKTPRFAAYSNQVILYPYWNVPASIAIIELFAKFKNNPKHIDELGMQLIDAKGNVVDHRKLNWKNYSKSYFPFRIRQSTGCDNLIMGPTCSIIYENEPMEANTMLRSPRRLSSTFLSAKQLRTSIVQGLVITAGCLGFGYYLMQHQQNETMVRTAIFITLLFCNIFLTFANRSFQYSIFKTLRYKNNLIPLIAGITILFILSLLYIPFVQQVFHLGTLPFAYLMICIAVALVSTFWIEIRKLNSSHPFSKGEGQKSSPLERI